MLKILTSGRRLAAHHYISLVRRARAPVFFSRLGVADTNEGRFDLLILHLWPVLERMRLAGADSLAQLLVDRVFTGFEDGLREDGTGDTATLRALKSFADAFSGRIHAYDCAGDETALGEALARNLWPGAAAADIASACAEMTHYLTNLRQRLTSWQPMQEALDFGPLPG